MITIGAFLAAWLSAQGTTTSAPEPAVQIDPQEGELRLWRARAEKAERVTGPVRVTPQDRLGSPGGSPARLSVNGELFATIKGVEAGPEEGLAVSRTEKKITLRLFRGRLVVDSVDVEVAVETPHAKVEGKSVYFLVDASKESSRIVPIDGKLKLYPDLGGPVEAGPGETVTLAKGKEPVRGKSGNAEAEVLWTTPLEASKNLIKNPGFERGLEDWFVLRTPTKVLVHVDDRVVFSGKKSARIDLPNIDFSEASVPAVSGVSGCALYQVREKLPQGRYVLRFWVRTENFAVDGQEVQLTVGSYARQLARTVDDPTPLICPRANGEWRCARFLVEPRQTEFIDLYFPKLKDPKSRASGTFWVDDIVLIPLESKK